MPNNDRARAEGTPTNQNQEGGDSRLVYLLTPVMPQNLNIFSTYENIQVIYGRISSVPKQGGPTGDCTHTFTLLYPRSDDWGQKCEWRDWGELTLITAPPPPGPGLSQHTPPPGLTKKKNRQTWWPTVKVFHNRDFGKRDAMFNSPGLPLWLRQCT